MTVFSGSVGSMKWTSFNSLEEFVVDATALFQLFKTEQCEDRRDAVVSFAVAVQLG